jgi:AraC-like DNA-binding protein
VLLRQANEFPPVDICGALTFEHWYIAPEVMRQAAEERGSSGAPRFAQEVTEDPRTHQLLTCATTALKHETGALEQQETLTHLLDAILGRYAEQRRIVADVVAHRAVRRMRDLIRDCCAEELSLDALAKHAGLNKILRAAGLQARGGRAAARLPALPACCPRSRVAARRSPQHRIAYELGFCDQSHFIRCFRQVALVTPRQYQVGS